MFSALILFSRPLFVLHQFELETGRISFLSYHMVCRYLYGVPLQQKSSQYCVLLLGVHLRIVARRHVMVFFCSNRWDGVLVWWFLQSLCVVIISSPGADLGVVTWWLVTTLFSLEKVEHPHSSFHTFPSPYLFHISSRSMHSTFISYCISLMTSQREDVFPWRHGMSPRRC